jgi:DNA-binding response OmpR family regulator
MMKEGDDVGKALKPFAPDSDKPCLLVVDDDAIIREMLRTSLAIHYRVVCLPSGDGVIAAIDTFLPRLLVLDVNVPGGDGHEICERVRAEARFRRLPILFITVRKDDATFLKSLQSGGNSLVMKPFEIGEFREKVEFLLKAGPGW